MHRLQKLELYKAISHAESQTQKWAQQNMQKLTTISLQNQFYYEVWKTQSSSLQ